MGQSTRYPYHHSCELKKTDHAEDITVDVELDYTKVIQKPLLFSQSDLNDLVRDLSLSKEDA